MEDTAYDRVLFRLSQGKDLESRRLRPRLADLQELARSNPSVDYFLKAWTNGHVFGTFEEMLVDLVIYLANDNIRFAELLIQRTPMETKPLCPPAQ